MTTGPQIVQQTNGKVDAFVAGVGTGGTITGVGRYLRDHLPGVRIVAVEPALSPVLSGGSPGMHPIQGIGAGFVPEVLDRGVIDEIMLISGDESVDMAKRLFREEGLACGISSGANVAACMRLARRPEFVGKRIATVLCDGAERYMSSAMFA
jgi:cysteine synthase A